MPKIDSPKPGPAVKDLTGKVFTRLTVVRFAGKKSKRTVWLCRCICGKEVIRSGNVLVQLKLKSCGCLKAEKFPGINLHHGFSYRGKYNAFYAAWKSMRARCNGTDKKNKRRYHDRGITVSERWLTFENFRDDMLSTYKPGLSLHRINNDGNYEKDNCKWADAFEQASNTSTNRYITINGVTKILMNWIRHFGISVGTFYKRVNKLKMSEADALSTPTAHNGKNKQIEKMAKGILQKPRWARS